MGHPLTDERCADVIVVGAGPAGSSVAFHLATAGVDVLLLDKATFPRDKVCGDGLTPRAVKQLIGMGLDLDAPGWQKNRGLRIVGAGHRLELPWPDLASFPDFGMVRTRMELDEILARHAQKAGARLHEQTTVTGPVLDEATGRVVGVTARGVDEDGRRARDEITYRAPLVIACDGVSARLAMGLGLERRDDRPMAVAVRAYYETPRHDDEWMESWLELWAGEPGHSDLLPGYGWIFAVGDGTANVGLGLLSTSRGFQSVDYRDSLKRWLANTPAEWGFRDEQNRRGRIGSAALPMAFNRKPHYTRGVLLVGDSGGMVNPFNGEGIDYALETGRLAAERLGAPDHTLEWQRTLIDHYGLAFSAARRLAGVLTVPTAVPLLGRPGIRSAGLMSLVVRVMGNLITDDDADMVARVWRGVGRVSTRVDHRPPFV